MARIRSIHYDAWRSRKLAAVTGDAERMFWRLQPLCDDDGRAEDDPELIAPTLFPLHRDVDAEDVDGWLHELAGAGLIVRYRDADRAYLAVVRWGDYQKPRKPLPSKLPAPDSPGVLTLSDDTAHRPRTDRAPTAHSPATPAAGEEGSGGEVVTGGEGESEGEPLDTTPATTQPQRRSRLEQACELLARRELTRRHVDNPTTWLPAATRGKVSDHSASAYQHLAAHPTLTARALADLLEPPPAQETNTSAALPDAESVTPDPPTDEQLANNVASLRDLRRERGWDGAA